MTTWRDVARVRSQHLEWGCGEIAQALGCKSAYVRATFQRRGWPNANSTLKQARDAANALLVERERELEEVFGAEPDLRSPPLHVTAPPPLGRFAVPRHLSEKQLRRAERRANPWVD